MKNKNKILISLFTLQIISFLLGFSTMFFFIEYITLIPFFILFTILGIVIFFLSRKWIDQKKLKMWLMVNGISATAFLILSVLHNLLYALDILVSNNILSGIISVMGGTFFILSVLGSPIVFLVSTVVVIIMWVKNPANL